MDDPPVARVGHPVHQPGAFEFPGDPGEHGGVESLHEGKVGQPERSLPHDRHQHLVLARRERRAGTGLAEAPTQTPDGPPGAGGELCGVSVR